MVVELVDELSWSSPDLDVTLTYTVFFGRMLV